MKNTPYLYLIVHYNGLIALNISKSGNFKNHPGHVVGVGANLELARLKINSENITDNSTEEFLHHLRVQGEVVKPHWADKVDVGCLERMIHDMT